MTIYRQTNVAVLVGAAAQIAQWIGARFNIDLGITNDVLDALTILAVSFIGWRVGVKEKDNEQGT